MTSRFNTPVLVALACILVVGGCKNSGSSGTGDGGNGAPSPSTQSSAAISATPTVSTSPTPSPSSEPPKPADLSGKWTGTWKNFTPDNSTGTFTLRWKQHGTNLTGTITISGTPCLTGGTVTGKLRPGGSINFGVVSGEVEVNYAGQVKGDTMSGSYATSCGKAEGDWRAARN